MKHEIPRPTVTVESLEISRVEREVAEMRRILNLYDEHAELTQKMRERGLELMTSARTMTDIAEWVAAKHAVRVLDLVGPSRSKAIARARHEAMWMMRQRRLASGTHRWSYPQIGGFFGRHYSTVIHACGRHEERIAAGDAS